MARKSEWQEGWVGDERSRENVKSWFGDMAEGLTPYKAEILCDIETDRSKKMRAFMTDGAGKHFKLERTFGKTTFSVSRKVIPAPQAQP